MSASAQTAPHSGPMIVIHPGTGNTIMRVEHKLLVLSVTLAGAIAGAMSVNFGGFFVDSHAQTGQATAAAHEVADVTSIDDANGLR
jgi:uncharacterized membrane protein